jgi:predicted RNA binding protein YcfA (HicA-like mRNA interferase family)
VPHVSGKRLLRALERAGFEQTHVRGSHHYLRRPDGKGLVVIPVHGNRDLPTGTLGAILKQADLTLDDLAELL